MALTIQERLKDLRVERGLTLEQLAEQTHLSKSALGSYEAEDFKDISHYALIKLAKFYSVTADYLLGLSETKNHPNADLADLRVSDDMIELLKSGLVDNFLLCELAVHPDFPRLMACLLYTSQRGEGQGSGHLPAGADEILLHTAGAGRGAVEALPRFNVHSDPGGHGVCLFQGSLHVREYSRRHHGQGDHRIPREPG